MKYGIPYRGSKSKIAQQIIESLPPAKHFYDLCAGGCAIAHAAALSGKYQVIHINDVNPLPIKLFYKALLNEYKDEWRFISRDEFRQQSGKDPYITYCWSFGNRPESYIYSKKIAPLKNAIHRLIMCGDPYPLRDYGVDASILVGVSPWRQRWYSWLRFARGLKLSRKFLDVDHLARLIRLRDLATPDAEAAIATLADNPASEMRFKAFGVEFVATAKDYQRIKPDADAVLYADIPYEGTDADYCKGFDRQRFLDWAKTQKQPLFISEYALPQDGFRVVREMATTCTASATATNHVVEKLFVPMQKAG